MSLIHDALKSMDAPHGPEPAVARPAAAPARPAWLDAVLAFAAVVAVGGLGWFVWQTQMPPKHAPFPDAPALAQSPPAAAQALPAEAAPTRAPEPVPLAPLPAPAGDAPAVAQPAQPAPATGPAQPSAAPEGGAPDKAPTAVASRTEAKTAAPRTPARRDRNLPRAAPAAPQAAAAAADDTPVELRFASFLAAMKDGRTDDAAKELAVLKNRLPAGSLGLLRAQAWFDLRAGRDAAAEEAYRSILERMPGDEQAAINLASIQSRQQRPEEARATLDAAARLQPDSTALRAALAQFTPMARP